MREESVSERRPFVHLHLHSEFSLADGMVRIKPLVERLVELEMPAVALTDLANLYGAVKFYRACLGAGIKPVLGADVRVQSPLDPGRTDRLVLLCRDNEGYRGLCRLLTRAWLDGQEGHPGRAVVPAEALAAESGSLIALVDAEHSVFTRELLEGSEDRAERLLLRYQELFGDRLYLELARVGRPHEEVYIDRALAVAARRSLPVAASNRVQFLHAAEFDAHEIRVCINEGRVLQDRRRPRLFTDQQYLRDSDEMADLFADIPEALDNTLEIARRCNAFLRFDRNYLPAYPDAGAQPVEEVLREQTARGLAARLGVERLFDGEGRETVDPNYVVRMNLELDVINEMGFPGYFLIVADFIRWAREHRIPVGPGRGSGAGSVVAWALGITELDPLRFGLLFERFLNPERVSLPDFDIDFCMEGRDRVIEYVAERYGRDQVAQIITFGTMAARAVVRDVGRVMGLSYGFVDTVAKLIPFEIGMTLEKALQQEEVLRERYENETEIAELIDTARSLEGLARNVGKHAGGVVIAPRPLTEFTPLYAESAHAQAVTQFDKDDLEAVGLVKFDFLGLRTLTIIDRAVKLINAGREKVGKAPLVIEDLPLDDARTFDMIKAGRTTAMFQMESRGMKEWIVKLLPDSFDDLVALVALYRPGPLGSGMVQDFVNRKHGRERIHYPHPDLEPILKETYGVILYQEQVMQIAQVLAGYSLGGADLLRRAMGKKKPEEMAKQRAIFMAGAEERAVDAATAEYIFDLMEKFAGYGFNKSHSAAYALIAYQTAWLKAHYPAAFMAASMSSDMEHTDKIVVLINECRELGLSVEPPDINLCGFDFRPVDEGTILYGLGAVKGGGAIRHRVDRAGTGSARRLLRPVRFLLAHRRPEGQQAGDRGAGQERRHGRPGRAPRRPAGRGAGRHEGRRPAAVQRRLRPDRSLRRSCTAGAAPHRRPDDRLERCPAAGGGEGGPRALPHRPPAGRLCAGTGGRGGPGSRLPQHRGGAVRGGGGADRRTAGAQHPARRPHGLRLPRRQPLADGDQRLQRSLRQVPGTAAQGQYRGGPGRTERRRVHRRLPDAGGETLRHPQPAGGLPASDRDQRLRRGAGRRAAAASSAATGAMAGRGNGHRHPLYDAGRRARHDPIR